MKIFLGWKKLLSVAGVLISALLMAPNAFAVTGGWYTETPITSGTFLDVALDGTTGLIGNSNGTVLRSTDSGKTWSLTTPGMGSLYRAVEIPPASPTKQYLVGEGGVILKSVDSGLNWSVLTSGTTNALYDITMKSTSVGWVVGVGGKILATADGSTWAPQTSNTTADLWGVSFFDKTVGVAVGNGGTIRRTTNAGSTWDTIGSGTTQDLLAVTLIPNSTIGFAVGANGTILRSSNSGMTWVPYNTAGLIPPLTILTDVKFFSSTLGLIVGNTGVILETTNGGASWAVSQSGTTNGLQSVAFGATSNDRLAVGSSATILGYDVTPPGMVGTVSLVSGGTSTTNQKPPMSWTAAADTQSGIGHYEVAFDGDAYVSVGTSLTYTPTNALSVNSHSFNVRAVDGAGNVGSANAKTFTVTAEPPPADVTGPAVINITPITVTPNTTQTITAYASDVSGVLSCDLYENFVLVGSMTLNDNSGALASRDFQLVSANLRLQLAIVPLYTDAVVTRAYAFGSSGTHSFQVKCWDPYGNLGTGSQTITILAGAADMAAPTVSAVSPLVATVGTAVNFQSIVSDNVGVASCNLWINASDHGAMTVGGGLATASFTFFGSETASVQVKCLDAANNQGVGNPVFVVVSPASVVNPNVNPNPTTPSASASSLTAVPNSVVSDGVAISTVTVTVRNSSGSALASKIVTLNSSRPGNDTVVTLSGTTNDLGQATFTVKSSSAGASVYTAVADGLTIGSVGVTFAASGTTQPATPGSLIKLACPATVVAADHPCKAVYFYGSDGKRHAFSNDKVYFTWYVNFDSVKTVDLSFLSSLPLGKNVTYRPGIRMVKFITVNTVYAVSRGGLLRPVAGEAVARALYGTDWNKKIDDISDAFFGNYQYGASVNAVSDFAPTSETSAVTTVDANL